MIEPRIIIRFIRTPGFVTSAICWVTASLFDHVEFGVEKDGKLVGWLGAHSSGGVQLRAVDYCKPTFERRYAYPVAPHEYLRWKAHAFSKIGTPYNFLDIAGLLLRMRKMTTKHRLICSQFCAWALHQAGVEALNVAPGYYHLVTPETLHLSPLWIGNEIHAEAQRVP